MLKPISREGQHTVIFRLIILERVIEHIDTLTMTIGYRKLYERTMDLEPYYRCVTRVVRLGIEVLLN